MALSEERLGTTGTLDALWDLSEVHACREVIQPFACEHHGAYVGVCNHIWQLLFQSIDVMNAHEIPRRVIHAKRRYMIFDGVEVGVRHRILPRCLFSVFANRYLSRY